MTQVTRRVVLDTNVVVAALRSNRGASRLLLLGAFERRYTLLMSVPLMLEYEAVLTRPEHLVAAGVSNADVHDILDAIASVIQPVRLAYLWRPALPDGRDDMVLETAVNGGAELLVTLNQRDFEPTARIFDVDVVTPAEALARLRKAK